MSHLKPKLLSACITATLLLVAPLAHAQTTMSDPSAAPVAANQDDAVKLESVTVSARGVEESLQAVPLPITAVTAATIENKGFENISDIARFSPGFSFREAFGRAGDRPVIRGMSNVQGEPNASFFIDGVFVQGDISGYGLENLERVEVVRGPQSAAFGRRTFSGAVNFITKRPGSDPGGKLTVGAGAYGQYKYSGFYSANLIEDVLAFDISLTHRGNDGIFYNPVSGTKDVGGTETTGGLASVLWTPTNNLSVIGRFGVQKTKDQIFPIARMGSDKMNCYLPSYTGASMGTIPISSTRRKGSYCGTVSSPTEFPLNTPQFLKAGYRPGTQSDSVRSSLVVDYLLPNSWSLVSTSAYNENTLLQVYDQDFSAARGFGGAFESIVEGRTRDFSQDLRLTTDQTQPFYASVGAYYYKQGAGRGYTASLAGFDLAPGMPLSPVVRAPTHPDNETVNKAVYAFINWDINERWTASLEGRYAEDDISSAATDVRSVVLAGQQQLITRPYALQASFKSFTPRATLGYHWKDNVYVYGLVSKGTKPGGFNADVQRADVTETSRAELNALGYASFHEEKAWNYELGVKSDWLDGRLRVNASAYFIDWDSQQLTAGWPVHMVDNSMFLTSYTTNIGKSRVRGFELESQWEISRNWMAHLSYSLIDARFVRFISQGQADLFSDANAPTLDDPAADAAGNYLPRVPKNQLSLGLMYQGKLTNGWGWMVNGDTAYESARYQVNNLYSTGGSTRTNFRLSIDPTDHLRVTAYVTNAFNDRTPEDLLNYIDPTAMVGVPAIPPQSGVQVTNLNDMAVTAPRPRMWGVEVSYRF